MKQTLQNLFKDYNPLDLHSKVNRNACVSLILKGASEQDLEIAFIQRAINPQDRWSGHLAFPGGTREVSDKDDLSAALRETHEEVGIILDTEELIGRLDDVHARNSGATTDFFIRPFVFYTQRDFNTVLNPEEVADFFWIPFKEISNPQRQTHYEFKHNLGTQVLPAVNLDRSPPLWGLTYKMVLNLLQRF